MPKLEKPAYKSKQWAIDPHAVSQLAKMPELNEEEIQSGHSSDNSPPSSLVNFEKAQTGSPNDSTANKESTHSGSCQNSPVSSCSEEYTTIKPQSLCSTEIDHEEVAEFSRDDKLE